MKKLAKRGIILGLAALLGVKIYQKKTAVTLSVVD